MGQGLQFERIAVNFVDEPSLYCNLRYLSNHTIFNRTQRLYHAPFVASVILLALWQITTFQYTLKWDAIDITLPWRYFVSDAIYQNGVLPWWNPFQHHGFAQGLSLETWYPIAHLLGFLRPYDLYSLNLEYLIHLLIASYGFYRLARQWGVTHQGALWGALVFPLTGFFIANSQHVGWIVSGSWIPHLIATFQSWLQKKDLKNALLLILISFMLVSGGYIAYTIVTGYIIGMLWVNHLLRIRKSKVNLRYFFWISARLLMVLILGLSLLLVAMWSLKSQIDRGAGLEGEALLKGSLYFRHLLSFIIPFSTLKGPYEFWQGDQSLMNVYIGIPALLLLFLSLKRLNQSFYRVGWVAVGLSLAMALAVELPLRKWMNILPFFDLFRLPSLFRYYAILGLVMIAARMIGEHPYPNDDVSRLRSLLIRISLIFLVLLVLVGLVLIIRRPADLLRVLHLNPETIPQAIIFQLGSHTILLSAFLTSVKYFTKRLTFYKILMLYTAADLIVSTQLNSRVSVLSEHPFLPMQSCLQQLPKGFPSPPLYDAIGSNSDQSLQMGAIYRNTNTLFKRFGWNGYTPYQYQSYIEFEKTPFFRKALGLPPVFVARTLIRPDSANFHISEPLLNLRPDQLSITGFNLNSITLQTQVTDRCGLVLNQNFTKGWVAKVDGKAVEVITVDHSLMGIHLEPGGHEVTFSFVPGNLLNAFWISLGTLLLVGLFYFWIERHSLPHRLFLVILASLILIKLMIKTEDISLEIPRDSGAILNQIDATSLVDLDIERDRFLDRGDLNRFDQMLINHHPSLIYYDRPLCNPQRELFIQHQQQLFPSIREEGAQDYRIFRAETQEDSILFQMLNGFEAPAPGWQDQGASIFYEENNFFQSLKGRDYSATYRLDLDTSMWRAVTDIRIQLDYRNTEPIEASLVFAVKDAAQNDLVWQSQILTDHRQESWRSKIWNIPKDTDWGNGRQLVLYVWNKGETGLEIDHFKLELIRHGKEH